MTEETKNRVATDELMALLMKEDKPCHDETIFTAIRAIAFRTPKRPIYVPNIGARCMNCSAKLSESQYFCPNCGLAILWEDY